jgi:hypothetical protein
VVSSFSAVVFMAELTAFPKSVGKAAAFARSSFSSFSASFTFVSRSANSFSNAA